jgi:hypothetical protein
MYVMDLSTPVVGAVAAAAVVFLRFIEVTIGVSMLFSGWLCSDSLGEEEDSE